MLLGNRSLPGDRAVSVRCTKPRDIRRCEAAQDFSERFIELARSVYRENDQRAELKRRISQACGSCLLEEKSYANWQPTDASNAAR